MTAATAPCDNLSHQDEFNRTKGFLGETLAEITEAASPDHPTLAEIRAMTNDVLLLAGQQAMQDIGDNLLVLDELRQRFRRGDHFKGYTGWKDFVTQHSRYSIKTIQRRLQEVHGKDESKVNHAPGNQYTRATVEAPIDSRYTLIHWQRYASGVACGLWNTGGQPTIEKTKNHDEITCEECRGVLATQRMTSATTEKSKAKARDWSEKDHYARIGRGLACAFSGIDERLDELTHIKKREWTPEAEEGIKCILLNLKEVKAQADEYATRLRAILVKHGKAKA